MAFPFPLCAAEMFRVQHFGAGSSREEGLWFTSCVEGGSFFTEWFGGLMRWQAGRASARPQGARGRRGSRPGESVRSHIARVTVFFSVEKLKVRSPLVPTGV